MWQVFGETLQGLTENTSDVSLVGGAGAACASTSCASGEGAWGGARLAPAQEHAVDTLVASLTDKLTDGKVHTHAGASYSIPLLGKGLHFSRLLRNRTSSF